jgi:hypothetical protein
MKAFVLVKHRLDAYVHTERKKKQGSITVITQLNFDSFGKKNDCSLYIQMNTCILYTRVASNRRVTCTYVSLNKHSTVGRNYHVKVTILCCIMNELRQIDYRNRRFLHFLAKVRN